MKKELTGAGMHDAERPEARLRKTTSGRPRRITEMRERAKVPTAAMVNMRRMALDGDEVCEGCRCIAPPDLDCEDICGHTSGAELIQQGLSSSSMCNAAAAGYYGSMTCYTTCKYSWFYRVDNVAGWDSCCCGAVKRFECSNCPCVEPCEPTCPGQDICDRNAPSWYSP